jgi:hypothetical protein
MRGDFRRWVRQGRGLALLQAEADPRRLAADVLFEVCTHHTGYEARGEEGREHYLFDVLVATGCRAGCAGAGASRWDEVFDPPPGLDGSKSVRPAGAKGWVMRAPTSLLRFPDVAGTLAFVALAGEQPAERLVPPLAADACAPAPGGAF